MKKSWKFTICMILFLLLPTACSPAEEAPDTNLSAPEELSEESLMEESIMEDTLTEDSLTEDIVMEDSITEDINDETTVNESQVLQEPDNPYRNNSESYGGSWMEALYEMHKGIPELETGKIIFAFCADPKEDFSHSFPFNRQVILPYFLEAETEPTLLKIQQYYSEQNWTLSQEEMESYENYIKSDDIFGVNEYNLWRVYRQERFITVVFDSFSTWGRGRSDPYADVFWTETGEHVTFADLFKGK